MNKNPCISIIVPVYKVEDVLTRCLESIVTQSYPNLEIILVDDGSPDQCGMLCDLYAQKDARIKVIHKTNGGLSDARNAGLIAATGDYVFFIDSDDFIDPHACEAFVETVKEEDFDVVIGGMNKVSGGTRHVQQPSAVLLGTKMSGQAFLLHELDHANVTMASTINLYRRAYLIEHDFFFEKGLLHEDEYWTPKVLLKTNNLFVLGKPHYHYLIREDSITTHHDFTKNAMHICAIVKQLFEDYRNLDDKRLRRLLNDYLVGLYLFAYRKGRLQSEPQRRFVLCHAWKPANRMKAALFFVSPRFYVWLGDRKAVNADA